jgi:hypothetical protein
VSSILDALEKLEAAAPRRTLALGAPAPQVRERRPRLTAAAAFATGALAALAATVLVSRRGPAPPPPPTPHPAALPVAPSLPIVPPVPPPAETTTERPWAQVDAPPTAPAPAPPPVVEAPVPRVHVSFLLYSKVPERRSVALAIEDGGLVTLHEGERTGGVEVARILPDRVELRYDGRTFAVRARD